MTDLIEQSELAYLTSERSLADAKCWGFVRTIHLFRFPEKYAQFWRYCRADFPMFEERQGEWTDFLTDRMELDPAFTLEQKAGWLTEKMNYVFRFLQSEDGKTDPDEWREYIIAHADGGLDGPADYRDQNGVLMTAEDILPSADEWNGLFIGRKNKKMSTERLHAWLMPQLPAEWPTLPEKPTERLILPGFPDYRPFETMGGVVVYFSNSDERN